MANTVTNPADVVIARLQDEFDVPENDPVVIDLVTEPGAVYCWAGDPITLTGCDRMAGHLGPHSWQGSNVAENWRVLAGLAAPDPDLEG